MLVSGNFNGLLAVNANIIYTVTHVLFETGDKNLRLLEERVYVASGRFIIEAGKRPVVEYLISELAAGGGK